MTLQSPFIISARLLPGVRVNGAMLSIDRVGTTADNRDRYEYHIDLPDGTSHTGSDLNSGCGGGTLQQGMASLLSFLSACAESYPDGEHADMFPPAIAEWAHQNSDELSILSIELEEAGELIEE